MLKCVHLFVCVIVCRRQALVHSKECEAAERTEWCVQGRVSVHERLVEQVLVFVVQDGHRGKDEFGDDRDEQGALAPRILSETRRPC